MRAHMLFGAALVLSLSSACAPFESVTGDPYPNGPSGPLEPPLIGRTPPTGPPPAPFEVDINVAHLVRRTLAQDHHLGGISNHVGVKVSKGIVTLNGGVASERDRQVIVDRVSKLPGVDQVDDQLAVNYSPAP